MDGILSMASGRTGRKEVGAGRARSDAMKMQSMKREGGEIQDGRMVTTVVRMECVLALAPRAREGSESKGRTSSLSFSLVSVLSLISYFCPFPASLIGIAVCFFVTRWKCSRAPRLSRVAPLETPTTRGAFP